MVLYVEHSLSKAFVIRGKGAAHRTSWQLLGSVHLRRYGAHAVNSVVLLQGAFV